MANGIRTDDSRGFNKGHSSKFCDGFRVQPKPEEDQRIYQPKPWGNNNSPKTLNDKNHQALSQKFGQLIRQSFVLIF